MGWNSEITGLPLLSSLGYFTTGDAAKEWNEFAGDFDFHKGLREEIEKGRLYLRLFSGRRGKTRPAPRRAALA